MEPPDDTRIRADAVMLAIELIPVLPKKIVWIVFSQNGAARSKKLPSQRGKLLPRRAYRGESSVDQRRMRNSRSDSNSFRRASNLEF